MLTIIHPPPRQRHTPEPYAVCEVGGERFAGYGSDPYEAAHHALRAALLAVHQWKLWGEMGIGPETVATKADTGLFVPAKGAP